MELDTLWSCWFAIPKSSVCDCMGATDCGKGLSGHESWGFGSAMLRTLVKTLIPLRTRYLLEGEEEPKGCYLHGW